jgi:hypothetical protein
MSYEFADGLLIGAAWATVAVLTPYGTSVLIGLWAGVALVVLLEVVL